jgi:hypothetical protein
VNGAELEAQRKTAVAALEAEYRILKKTVISKTIKKIPDFS